MLLQLNPLTPTPLKRKEKKRNVIWGNSISKRQPKNHPQGQVFLALWLILHSLKAHQEGTLYSRVVGRGHSECWGKGFSAVNGQLALQGKYRHMNGETRWFPSVILTIIRLTRFYLHKSVRSGEMAHPASLPLVLYHPPTWTPGGGPGGKQFGKGDSTHSLS